MLIFARGFLATICHHAMQDPVEQGVNLKDLTIKLLTNGI
jgi:hypothetical protein